MENFADVKYILNGFLFVFAGILVMWMSAGFAMLETGLTRSKNSVTILTKNILSFVMASIMFYIIGYDLMYSYGNSFLGYGFMLSGKITKEIEYPFMADFFFQVVFVATSTSVISGIVAERMKLLPFLIFIIILSAIIYPIQGHWSWGGSHLYGLMVGFSDFAGSTVVHSVGGWAALAGVLILGSRKGKFGKNGQVRPIPGSNLPLATLGTFILWMGWFGFNCGSQMALGTKTDINSIALIVASTNMAACAGAIMAATLSQIKFKKIDLTIVLNGTLAGLVSCTAGPNLGVNIALIEGLVGGALVFLAIPFFDKLKIDDPVGSLSVHLVAGIWGTIAVGIFNPEVILLNQLKGIVIVGIFVFVSSFIVWKILDLIFELRVDEEIEINGLDITQTGLEAYPEFRRA